MGEKICEKYMTDQQDISYTIKNKKCIRLTASKNDMFRRLKTSVETIFKSLDLYKMVRIAPFQMMRY